MFYLSAIQRLLEAVKNNNSIPVGERKKAQDLLGELAHILAKY